MKNDVEPDFLSQLDAIFAQLNPQAVEEFYAAYRQWSLQQRIIELRQRIDAVREQQADNEQRLQETRPSAIELAALARLQSNGVSNIALLDAMLERGESWLDQTMQRLDYFEQFDDFVSDDYTKWCQGALEGAFDWIDSLREATEQAASTQLETPPEEVPSNNEDAGDVEALLLQRLAIEDEQDDLSWQEAITLKQTTIKVPPPEIVTTDAEEQESLAPEDVPRQDMETQVQETEYVSPDEPVQYVMGEGQAERPEGDPRGRLHTPRAYDQVAEQAAQTEITVPQDTPTTEDTTQSEVNEPREIENSAPEDPHQEQVISSNRTARPAQSVPRKGSLMGRLIRFLVGV